MRLLGYGACFAAGCLWGTGFYFSRLALDEMSVDYMVLYRILFGCLGVLPVALLSRWRFTGGEFRLLVVSAALGIPICCILQFEGLAHTTVSHASLMVGAMPVLLGVAATLFAGERLDGVGWLALCGSTLGAALLTLGIRRGAAPGEPTLLGDLLVLVSLLFALAWILLSKKLMRTRSPSVVSAYTILIGGAMLLPWTMGSWLLSPLTHARVAAPPFAHVSLTAWGALAFSGLNDNRAQKTPMGKIVQTQNFFIPLLFLASYKRNPACWPPSDLAFTQSELECFLCGERTAQRNV